MVIEGRSVLSLTPLNPVLNFEMIQAGDTWLRLERLSSSFASLGRPGRLYITVLSLIIIIFGYCLLSIYYARQYAKSFTSIISWHSYLQ